MRWLLAATLGLSVAFPSPTLGQRMLSATPPEFDSFGYAELTLTWRVPSAGRTQIRIEAPDGGLFAEGGPSGVADTGRWVVAGIRFFLQDVSSSEPGITMATLTVPAVASSSTTVRFIAASANSFNPSVPEPPGAILLLDRDTGDQLARYHFDAPVRTVAVSPDGATIYVAVLEDREPGIAIVDLADAETRSFIPVPKLAGTALRAGSTLLVATYEPSVAVIDLASNAVTRSLPCPATPEQFLYNPRTRITYGASSVRNQLCVVSPDLQSDPPVQLAQSPTRAFLLDNGGAGVLLISSWDNVSSYRISALDLRTQKAFEVPSLEGVTPAFFRPEEPRIFYGTVSVNGQRAAQRYDISFPPDGAPVFTPLGDPIPVVPGAADDRYFYTGVSGYCSTLEGPVICSVGFRSFDRATFLPGPSYVFARTFNSTPDLFGLRAVALDLTATSRVHPAPGGIVHRTRRR